MSVAIARDLPVASATFGRHTSPRVIQVVLSLDPGGTERLVLDLVSRLPDGVVHAVCCVERAGTWANELSGRGVEVVALHRQPGFRPALGVGIAAVAARHGANVLHCHHFSPFVYGQIAHLLRPRLRVVFTEHGRLSDGPSALKRRLANRIVGRTPGAIYAVSADLKRQMIADGFPSDRVGVIYNGIEAGPKTTMADKDAARRALGLDVAAKVVGTAARLDQVKSLDTLLDAFFFLRRRAGDVELVVFGDGPERAALERRTRHLGLQGSVRFCGHVQNVRALMPALDEYVNCSLTEGISLTILEAMACSLPVVATAVGGTPEVVVHEQTGLLVRPRQPQLLADALATLLAAPARSRELGAAGRERLVRTFTIDRMLEAYQRAYSQSDEDFLCAASAE